VSHEFCNIVLLIFSVIASGTGIFVIIRIFQSKKQITYFQDDISRYIEESKDEELKDKIKVINFKIEIEKKDIISNILHIPLIIIILILIFIYL
jgi:hypothetical protein